MFISSALIGPKQYYQGSSPSSTSSGNQLAVQQGNSPSGPPLQQQQQQAQQQQQQQPQQAQPNLNNGGSGGSIYNGAAGSAGPKGGTVGSGNPTASPASAADKYLTEPDLTKSVFGGHELVSAISQITNQKTTGGVGKKNPSDPWGTNKAAEENTLQLLAQTEPQAGALSSNTRQGGHNGFGTGGGNAQGDGVEGSTDSVTSDTEDTAAAALVAAAAGFEFDTSKTSFARIASLNLEKQAVVKAAAAQQQQMQMQQQQMQQHQQQQQQQQHPHSQLNTNLPPPSLMGVSAQQQAAAAAQAVAMAHAQQIHHQHHQQQQQQQLPMIQLPPSNNPRYFFDLGMEGKNLGRVIIEVQPQMAPKMAQNFGMLVTHEKGFGYKGCQFFQVSTEG